MPPNTHAVLSPSSAERWLHCTRSARLEQEFTDQPTFASAEGTAAHALAEYKLRKALRMRSRRPVSEFDSDEMEELTDAYRDYVLEQLEVERQTCPDAQIFIETKLDLTAYVPGSFGTLDCIIVSDNQLHVIDLKYGQGIVVQAKENPQMKLYALGALDIYDGLYDFKTVSMTIFQPRRENVSTWTESVEALRKWADEEFKPKAELANNGEGDFCSGDWCVFCKAAVRCRERAKAKLELAKHEFSLPPLISDEEIEEILPKLPDLTKWANDLMSYATDQVVLFLVFYLTLGFLCVRHNFFSVNIMLELAHFRFYSCGLKNEDNQETEQTIISHRRLNNCVGETLYLRSLNNEYKLDIEQK